MSVFTQEYHPKLQEMIARDKTFAERVRVVRASGLGSTDVLNHFKEEIDAFFAERNAKTAKVITNTTTKEVVPESVKEVVKKSVVNTVKKIPTSEGN